METASHVRPLPHQGCGVRPASLGEAPPPPSFAELPRAVQHPGPLRSLRQLLQTRALVIR